MTSLWKVGDKCEGQYSEDNQWYAAEVIEVKGPGAYVVRYTEYGNEEETEDQFLRPLPGAAAPAAAAPAPVAAAPAPVAAAPAPEVAAPAPVAAAPAPVAEPTPAAPAAPASRWKVGDVCEGQFSEDELWYKARIDEVLGDGKYKVTYTEYGNGEETEDQFLRPLAGAAPVAAAVVAAAPVVVATVATVPAVVAESAPASSTEDDAWGSASAAPAAVEEKQATDTLFVGGLSFRTSEQGLQDFFSQYGTVLGARIATDRDTGKSRGFGYVQFDSVEAAQTAYGEANGQSLDERSLRLDYSESKPSRGPRPSFGGSAPAGGAAAGAGDKANTDTLFIGSLPNEATESDLQTLGEPFGVVMSARIPRDRDTGNTKGIGYIQYGDASATQAAYKGLFGAQLHGAPLRIDYARPSREFDPTKAPAPSSGGFGSSSGGFGSSNGGFGGGFGASSTPSRPPTLTVNDADAKILARNRTIAVDGLSVRITRNF